MANRIHRALLIIFAIALASAVSSAQFRPGTSVATDEKPAGTLEAMSGHGENIFSSLFDPMRFSSHQTYSFSMISGGGGSVGLGMFTNTFGYRASDNLMIRADVSAVYSPFSSFGSAYQKSLNGIYLTNASLDWRVGDNTFVRVSYSASPYYPFSNNSYYDPFYYSAFPRAR
ncbi:MAG TPA: hypothetical protein VEW28_08950 [Candidatus Kapabacteria bacterium]|nr:hypothetical protein [Candidatus Kapabacteria bacterium]